MRTHFPTTVTGYTIKDPAIARFLFSDVRSAWIWVILRIWLGYAWFEASLHKISDPAWVGSGDALKGFWTNAINVPETGRPLIAYDWYRSFLTYLLDHQAYTWFGRLVKMMYQFEEPFVVDYGKFAQAFGNQATPLPAAIQATVAWWRQNDNLPS